MCIIKSIFRTSLLATAVALVSGCAGTGGGTSANTSSGPAVDPASIIQIHGSYNIPVNKARVYFQNGAEIAQSEIDRWTTYCSMLVQNVQYSDQPQQTVLPGRFEITKVIHSDDARHISRVYVASLIWVRNPQTNITYKVEMRLRSVEQPDVRSLICEKRVDRYGRYHPSGSEIHTALGSLIEIDMPL